MFEKVLPKLIFECVSRGIVVEITQDCFIIRTGFYTSGICKLYPCREEEGQIVWNALTRYNTMDEIKEFDDLVRLNHAWWQDAVEQKGESFPPDEPWASEIERLCLQYF